MNKLHTEVLLNYEDFRIYVLDLVDCEGTYRIYRYSGEITSAKLKKVEACAFDDIAEACEYFHSTIEKKINSKKFHLPANGTSIPCPGLVEVFSPAPLAIKPQKKKRTKKSNSSEEPYRKIRIPK